LYEIRGEDGADYLEKLLLGCDVIHSAKHFSTMRGFVLPISLTPKSKTVDVTETLINFYHTAPCHTSEHSVLNGADRNSRIAIVC